MTALVGRLFLCSLLTGCTGIAQTVSGCVKTEIVKLKNNILVNE